MFTSKLAIGFVSYCAGAGEFLFFRSAVAFGRRTGASAAEAGGYDRLSSV